ncbi:hypothetical protein DAPPUDRAFT_117225 [Daphnia pulex]|uniref:Uncharacterized protein n=1 Tax=Daphnia pulex TaxID=6669 RepID=E9HRY4_DAPPU|nr:hypothetical protein DAPPUDRAFT_117225 [Daphnia pulex]|eukprot:EFX65500.1 hypothetical protein DAPPUDRAFT_117225 [Daphnia pulex]
MDVMTECRPANSSSCSDLAALDHTRNSISLLQSQDSTPKRNRDDEFLQFDTGSTHSATGSAKHGVGALSRRSVSQNHRAADSSYGVVPHNDSGSLNVQDLETTLALFKNRVAVSQNRKAVSSNRGNVSRYDEAGSSNSDSGFRNGVNRSLDRNSLSVNRATDSTRGTTPAIGSFHRIHPYFRGFGGCFRNTVEKNLDLPLKEVENVSALNTALIDIDLSVNLSGVLIEVLGHVSYESTLAKSIMDYIFTRELCCKVQWKGRSGRISKRVHSAIVDANTDKEDSSESDSEEDEQLPSLPASLQISSFQHNYVATFSQPQSYAIAGPSSVHSFPGAGSSSVQSNAIAGPSVSSFPPNAGPSSALSYPISGSSSTQSYSVAGPSSEHNYPGAGPSPLDRYPTAGPSSVHHYSTAGSTIEHDDSTSFSSSVPSYPTAGPSSLITSQGQPEFEDVVRHNNTVFQTHVKNWLRHAPARASNLTEE